MERPTVVIHDAATNTSIEREMNDVEFNQYQIDQENASRVAEERATKLAARQSAVEKLTALGLTEQEIEALLVQ